MSDPTLGDAFRALRDRHDGHHPDVDATLRRALRGSRTFAQKRSWSRWIVLPAAAVLVGSTAWAGVTGKLATAVHDVADVFHTERAPAPLEIPKTVAAPVALPAPAPAPTPAPVPSAPAIAEMPVETQPTPVIPTPALVAAPRTITPPTPPIETAAPLPAPAPTPAPSSPDPHEALFAEAHRLHFVDKDPARALAAWSRYLDAAPRGRFAPEARYNHALALVRLGRSGEAAVELRPFADGSFGDYHRTDATALLEALKSP